MDLFKKKDAKWYESKKVSISLEVSIQATTLQDHEKEIGIKRTGESGDGN